MLRYAVSILAVCLTTALVAYAGEGYFGYDEFGRINRSFDEQNRVTDYSYDPAGNIIGIHTNIPELAPTVTNLAPDALRRGELKVIQVTGTNLLGVNISSPDPGLVVSNVGTMQSTDTQVSFTLTATTVTVLGTRSLTFSNSAGSTSTGVTVNPAVPTAYTMPGPLALPPDSVERPFILRLSNTDTIAHSFTITVADPTVVAIAATTATIPAGAMETQIPITGLKAGQTAITFDSSTLGAITFVAYVTTDYQEMNKVRSALVGVVVQESPQPPPSVTYSPMSAPHVGIAVEEQTQPPAPATIAPITAPLVGVSVQETPSDPPPTSVTSLAGPLVGVALGGAVTGMTPTSASVGQAVTLTIGGNALDAATAVEFVPDTGITPGVPSIAPDGASLTVEVVIAADAPQTIRRVKVLAGTEELPASDESMTQFQIAP
jgi:YD repeat-containing protein